MACQTLCAVTFQVAARTASVCAGVDTLLQRVVEVAWFQRGTFVEGWTSAALAKSLGARAGLTLVIW